MVTNVDGQKMRSLSEHPGHDVLLYSGPLFFTHSFFFRNEIEKDQGYGREHLAYEYVSLSLFLDQCSAGNRGSCEKRRGRIGGYAVLSAAGDSTFVGGPSAAG